MKAMAMTCSNECEGIDSALKRRRGEAANEITETAVRARFLVVACLPTEQSFRQQSSGNNVHLINILHK
jgi:hypothetical protein